MADHRLMSSPALRAYLRESRSLTAIAWPMFIAQLAQMGTGVVDTVMAGHYGATDLAAIAIGFNLWLPLFLFFLGVTLGAAAIVAQDFGAGRLQRVRDLLPQSIWLALVIGACVAPLCFFADPLLGVLGLEEGTRDKARAYLQAVAFGLPAAALFQALRCHTQGIGLLRPFALASVACFLANIPLNYAFIFGHWGLPEMGAAGCGLATAISMWLGPLLITFHMVRNRELQPYLPARYLARPDPRLLIEIARVGLPIGFTFFLEVGVLSVVALLIAGLGDFAIAAHQIAFNIWDILYIPLVSLGSAMATRMGHAIGAGDRDGVHRSVATGMAIAALVALAATILLLSVPELIVRAYTPDSRISLLAVDLIRLATLFILFDAIQVTVSFCLRAFKDTRFPFLVTCLSYWLISLPLGCWLGLVLAQDASSGTRGFWQAMILGIGTAALLVSWRLRRTLRRPLIPPAATGSTY